MHETHFGKPSPLLLCLTRPNSRRQMKILSWALQLYECGSLSHFFPRREHCMGHLTFIYRASFSLWVCCLAFIIFKKAFYCYVAFKYLNAASLTESTHSKQVVKKEAFVVSSHFFHLIIWRHNPWDWMMYWLHLFSTSSLFFMQSFRTTHVFGSPFNHLCIL